MFEPHCQYSIDIQGAVMVTILSGAWNREGAKKYAEDVKTAAENLVHKPWCRIADLSDFDGGPMEVMDELIELQQWSRSNNCVRLLLVAPKLLNKSVIDSKAPVYPDVDQVATLDEAIQRANELLISPK